MEAVQYFEGNIPGVYQYCIDDVKGKLPFYVPYNFISKMPDKYKESPKGFPLPPRRYTVEWRMELLVEKPDRLWLDTDMLINEWPTIQFLPGKPYIYNGTCAVAAIYCNNCPDVIQTILDEYRKKNGSVCACQIIRIMKDRFYEFPDGCFQHLQLGKMMGVKGTWIRQSNSQCTVIKRNDEAVFEKIEGRVL